MNIVKTLVLLMVVSSLALFVIWCGPPGESEKEEEDVVVTEMSEKEPEEAQLEAANTLGVPVEITNSIGMKLRLIPAGSFMMGAHRNDLSAQEYEGPYHRVVISKPFYIGAFEVTQEQYLEVTGSLPEGSAYHVGQDRPVVMVTWENAVNFCQLLSELEGETYRLPTEAEWEYACRAGTTTNYYWGTYINDEYAWYIQPASRSVRERETLPVGQKRANPWGLHDMSGNVNEWCFDWFDRDYYTNSPEQNPNGPSQGTQRVLRGGGYFEYSSDYLRSYSRMSDYPGLRSNDRGFRCVRDLEIP